MPEHVELIGFQDKVLHRNPTPLRFLSVLELLPEVLLKGKCKIKPVIGTDIPFQFTLESHVLRLLERWFNAIGEREECLRVGSAVFKTLEQLVQIRYLAGIIDATTLIIDTRKKSYCEISTLPTGLSREADCIVARVIEDIVGSAIVSTFGVHTMQSQAELLVASLDTTATTATTGIGVIPHIDVTFHIDVVMSIGQRGIIKQHHTAHGSETIADTLGSFHHFDHARSRIIKLGGMVGPPTLAFESHTVVHQKDTTTVHALYDRLRNGVARADGTHAGDGLKHLGQRTCTAFLQFF